MSYVVPEEYTVLARSPVIRYDGSVKLTAANSVHGQALALHS